MQASSYQYDNGGLEHSGLIGQGKKFSSWSYYCICVRGLENLLWVFMSEFINTSGDMRLHFHLNVLQYNSWSYYYIKTMFDYRTDLFCSSLNKILQIDSKCFQTMTD